jgi:chromosome segregation ATPase
MSLEDLSFEQRDEMALLMQELSRNPKTRKSILKLTQEVRPDLHIPENEIDNSLQKISESANEKIASLEAKLREKDALDNLRSRRDALIKKGFAKSDEEVSEIEKVMLEKKIPDHETAAEYWQWMKQSATPTGHSSIGYNPSPLKGFNLSEYWKNPQQGARNEAAKALAELRKNTRPIGF